GGAVTIEDYLKCFEDATGRDLSHFALWYHQAGTPVIGARSTYDAAEGRLELTLSQSTPPTPGENDKKPLHIPLRVGLISPNGDDMEPSAVSGGERTGDVLHLTESEQTFVFEGLGAKPAISLNRDFSAPVRVRFDQPREDRLKIAGAESDLVARWDAINGLALEVLTHATAAVRAGRSVDTDSALAAILIETAEDSSLEPAFRALALTLPSELDIGREIGEDVDPDAIHLARKAVFSAIANAGRTSFARLVEDLREDNGFSPDADSAGRRALRNTALAYLAEAEQSPLPAQCAYEAATNMTDMIAALRILAHQFPGSGETGAVLADFRQRFEGEPLVLDKWFSVQAMGKRPETLDQVIALSRHPDFSTKNPNRIRSLVGMFCAANQVRFHDRSGRGYAFLADIVLDLDEMNP
ncbi:MAG: DUF3458 domain-containing protein, partial [Martelella sp.]